MRQLALAVGVALSLAAVEAQSLSSVEIAAAIEEGRAGKKLQKQCGASGENGFDIIVEGPVGRIMRATREAKRRGGDFTAADVTASIGANTLTVIARRDPTLTSSSLALPMPGGPPGHWVPTESTAAEHTRARSTMGYTYGTSAVIRSKPPRSEDPIVLLPARGLAYSRVAGGDLWSPRTWTGPFPGSSMMATFDLAEVRAIEHKDIEVVVFMTDAGEHRCKISDKDLRTLR